MHRPRLDNLSDGIFAIVMTILVLDFHVPEILGVVTNHALFAALQTLTPTIFSYILSFLVLATYWMAHHFMMSLIAQNLNRALTYLNIPFLMFVGLIPFSAKLLSTYYYTPMAVMVYGLNVVLIGLSLLLIARYIIESPDIHTNPDFSVHNLRIAYIRILIPPIAAIIAIIASFWYPKVSIALFIVSIILNLIPGTLHFILRLISLEPNVTQ